MLELHIKFHFFFKQKTAYDVRISDGSSDVCSSDLRRPCVFAAWGPEPSSDWTNRSSPIYRSLAIVAPSPITRKIRLRTLRQTLPHFMMTGIRSEEHTSELPSLMRMSYAVSGLSIRSPHQTPRLQRVTRTLHRYYSQQH